ncbi:unnamed protein product [Discosporangium mesarthrocarpum]
MEENLLERVERCFTLFRQHGGKARRHKKRSRAEKVRSEAEALAETIAANGGGVEEREEGEIDINEHRAAQKAKVSINIFEDIDDRYIPPSEPAPGSSQPEPPLPAAPGGYFGGLRAPKVEETPSNKDIPFPSRLDISATVKAAARAAAARLAAASDPSSGSGGGVRGGTAGMRGRIERDMFEARPSRGQALGVGGNYDVYPETGDYETYDSDEVGGREGRDTSKPDSKGAGGASGKRGADPSGHPAFDAPKASFPFGVKSSDMSARKGGRSRGGSKHRIDNELNMINKYMKGDK